MHLRFAGLLVAGLVLPAAVQAQDRTYPGHADRTGVYQERAAPFGAPVPVRAGGRAPWSPDWAYDSGGDNDRRPELPAYQQGGGQQTGGPARNLLPDDGFHIVPR